MPILPAMALAAATSLAVCGVVVRWAPALGMVDRPDAELKTHGRPVAVLGGLGVLAGILAGGLASAALDGAFVAAAVLVVVVGTVDDRRGLPPLLRLGSELAAALVVVVGSPRAGALEPLGTIALIVLTLVAINAVNLVDGLDGLVGAVGTVSAVGLAALAAARGTDPAVGLLLGGALLGFLVWNRAPARLFLGDGGSYLVGLALAFAVVEATPTGGGVGLLVAAGTLGLFLVDLGATVVRRLRSGAALFGGDRDHFYDVLRRRGWSTGRVVIVAVAGQVGFVALTLATAAAFPDVTAVAVLVVAGILALLLGQRLGLLALGDRR